MNSIFLEDVNQQEVVEICNTFRSGTATGYDTISMSSIKDAIDLISSPLMHLINLDIFTNYRSVSVLPAFSKFLERVIYNRLLKLLNKCDILSDSQYGFRKNNSPAYAITYLYDKISSSIDNKDFTVGIFIDLSKAFDTVDHKILVEKLEHYGIRGAALNWFSSYLNNREQFVDLNGHRSSFCKVECGVPQGSILGPLLFLVYINDLSNISKVLDFILFADDSNIFFSHKDINILSETLNSELSRLTQ